MNTLKSRIASLLQQLNERVFEKEHIVALALLSAVAGESIFLLGSGSSKKYGRTPAETGIPQRFRI